MTNVNTEAGSLTSDARRARDSTTRLIGIYALSLALCTALSALAHAQTTTASRGARETLNRNTTMTELNTVDVPRDTPVPRTKAENQSIRPFHFNVSDEALKNLRRRIRATQWPEKETVNDESQGVPLATMQELARYWATEYDWRKVEAQLNALPQFIT